MQNFKFSRALAESVADRELVRARSTPNVFVLFHPLLRPKRKFHKF